MKQEKKQQRITVAGFVFAVALSVIFCGCMKTVAVPPTPTGTTYLPPDAPVIGRPDHATIYDLKRLVNEVLDKMKADHDFMDALSSMKREKGMKPDLVVALVDNKSGDEEIREMCRPIRNFMNEWLNSLFFLKNDDNSLVLAHRVWVDVTGGNKDANKRITPDSLDLYLRTQLENKPQRGTDGVHWYAINVTLYDLHTGRNLWVGNRDFYKGNAK